MGLTPSRNVTHYLVMSNTSADLHPIHELLASDLASVDIAEESVMKRAEHVGFDEDARMDLGLAVREAMVNAVAHGNNYNPKKMVTLSIHTSMDSLRVVILDQGAGFEVKAVPDPLDEQNLMKTSGRGLLMMQTYVDELSVKKGANGGTEVVMVKYLP